MLPARTKIVATLGPSSTRPGFVARLVERGVRVFRINCSHTDETNARAWVEMVRRAAKRARRPCAILFDLQGPRIRVGTLPGPSTLRKGDTIRLFPGAEAKGGLPLEYARLLRDVRPGERVLLNDGRVALDVRSRGRDHLVAKVVRGGPIATRKGVNFPDSNLRIPAITPKDRKDLRTAARCEADYVALSFVREGGDLLRLRKILDGLGLPAGIVAKIERREAVERIDGILAAADSIMVARGDLGIEISLEKVPLVQRRLIAAARGAGKPVITATQMLDSMMTSSIPTRAEVSDIHHAVLDGTDAVMLTGETAGGEHPIEAVDWLARVVVEAEKEAPPPFSFGAGADLFQRIAENVRDLAREVGAKRIVCFSRTGLTARAIAATHAEVPVIALTPFQKTRRACALYAGVSAYPIPRVDSVEAALRLGRRLMTEKVGMKRGDRYVLVVGPHFLGAARTNIIQIVEV